MVRIGVPREVVRPDGSRDAALSGPHFVPSIGEGRRKPRGFNWNSGGEQHIPGGAVPDVVPALPDGDVYVRAVDMDRAQLQPARSDVEVGVGELVGVVVDVPPGDPPAAVELGGAARLRE